MHAIMSKTSLGLHFAQIAWVVKDIMVTKRFFENVMGISNFSKVVTIRVKEFDATYYGKPSDAASLVSQAYSGGTFIELIQPIAGPSIIQDYIDKNPAGGMQHVAYSIPIANFDKVIFEFENNGFPVISTSIRPLLKLFFLIPVTRLVL